MGQHPWRRLRLGIKRAIDVVVAGGLLFALSPVYLAIYLIVRSRMGHPAIFTQERPGLHGTPFMVRKFRTMIVTTTDETGRPLGDAERTPKLGHFLRKTSLDELPQLISVLRGDMSLIGPRPLRMAYLDLYTSEQMRRHDMSPGITGWAQINGRNNSKFSERFQLDVWYVDNWSLMLDLKILVKTIKWVARGSGVITGQPQADFDDLGFLDGGRIGRLDDRRLIGYEQVARKERAMETIDIVIYGSGGCGKGQYRHLAHPDAIIVDRDGTPKRPNVIGFLDDDHSRVGSNVQGLPVLGNHEWLLSRPGQPVVFGIGSSKSRKKVADRIQRLDIWFPTFISPEARIPSDFVCGEGCFVSMGAIADLNVKVGDFAFINKLAILGHDTMIGDYFSASPGAVVGGCSKIGTVVDVGANAMIIQGHEIGDYATIGAMACVTKNVPAYATAIGVPARVIKILEPAED